METYHYLPNKQNTWIEIIIVKLLTLLIIKKVHYNKENNMFAVCTDNNYYYILNRIIIWTHNHSPKVFWLKVQIPHRSSTSKKTQPGEWVVLNMRLSMGMRGAGDKQANKQTQIIIIRSELNWQHIEVMWRPSSIRRFQNVLRWKVKGAYPHILRWCVQRGTGSTALPLHSIPEPSAGTEWSGKDNNAYLHLCLSLLWWHTHTHI